MHTSLHWLGQNINQEFGPAKDTPYLTLTGKLWGNDLWGFLLKMSASKSWWHHQMETVSALLAICAGNSPVPGEFPAQRPVTWSFDVFFDLHLNKRLRKQLWGWWFEMLSCPLWRHCNGHHTALLYHTAFGEVYSLIHAQTSMVFKLIEASGYMYRWLSARLQ